MLEFITIAAAENANGMISEAAAQAVHETSGSEQGVLGLLGLNWRLFLAQLVNFAIILFILWKWVFAPVTKALEGRTRKIEQSLRDAEKVKEELAGLEQFKAEQQYKARVEYQKILDKAQALAEQNKQEVLTHAKQQAEKVIADSAIRITAERARIITEAKGELAALVVAAAEKIISEKLDESKDAKLIKESLEQVPRIT